MKKVCKHLTKEKVKSYITIYKCELKKEIYFSKKKTCIECPRQIKIEF